MFERSHQSATANIEIFSFQYHRWKPDRFVHVSPVMSRYDFIFLRHKFKWRRPLFLLLPPFDFTLPHLFTHALHNSVTGDTYSSHDKGSVQVQYDDRKEILLSMTCYLEQPFARLTYPLLTNNTQKTPPCRLDQKKIAFIPFLARFRASMCYRFGSRSGPEAHYIVLASPTVSNDQCLQHCMFPASV